MSNSFENRTSALTKGLSKQSRIGRRQRKALVSQAAVASAPQRNDLRPELIVHEVTIALLKMPARQTRTIDPVHVAEVAESIRRYGVVRPVLIGTDNGVVDGMTVLEAAKLVGLTTLPCLMISHLSPAELRKLRLALNRLQEKGVWDLDELRLEFQELAELDESLEIVGFSPQEADLIVLSENADVENAADELPEIDRSLPAISRLGDIWMLGQHRLLCGDATIADSYGPLFGGGPQARAIFTDPPYNIRIDGFAVGAGATRHREFQAASGELDDDSFVAFLRNFMVASKRHLIDGGLAFVCMDWRHAEHLQRAAREAALQHCNTIVWNKGNGGLGGIYRSAHEFILLFKNGRMPHLNNVALGKHGRDRSNVWTYPGANQRGSSAHRQAANHPTPKPVELVADALLDVTAKNDALLDPFAGSGTTIIAAQIRGRVAYAIELDPIYVDLIVRRFQEFTGIEAVLEAGGKTFAHVLEERTAQSSVEPNVV